MSKKTPKCPLCGSRLQYKAVAFDDRILSKWRYCEKIECNWDERRGDQKAPAISSTHRDGAAS